MKIAVTGATGQLGQIVVKKLKDKINSQDIVALVRSIPKAAELEVEVREADYDKVETLDSALAGIDTLLLISASVAGKRTRQHQNIITSAVKAGVKWIVYTSLLRADASSLSLAGEHLDTEIALKESGIAYTLLRNGWYTENYTGFIPGAIAGGALLGSAGAGKISSAARVDFAEAAVAVLTSGDHYGKTYELAGDDPYTLSELAAEVSKQSGKDIPYQDLPASEYASMLIKIGLPEKLSHALAGWDVSASNGDLYEDNHQLSKLIGRPTTPMATTVGSTLQSMVTAV